MTSDDNLIKAMILLLERCVDINTQNNFGKTRYTYHSNIIHSLKVYIFLFQKVQVYISEIKGGYDALRTDFARGKIELVNHLIKKWTGNLSDWKEPHYNYNILQYLTCFKGGDWDVYKVDTLKLAIEKVRD